MQFFKHYHNARKNELLKEIINKQGAEGYGRYWGLLEVLCEKFDGENIEIAIHVDDLLDALFIKQSKKLSDFLEKFGKLSEEVYQKFGKSSVKVKNFQDNFYFFEVPILFDLQGKDFKFATSERLKSDPKNKSKDKRNKNKEKREKKKDQCGLHQTLHDDFLKPYFENVKLKTQEGWLKLYPNPVWVKTELIKGANWLVTSDAIRKDKGRFFTNWLSIASERKSKSIGRPSNNSYVNKYEVPNVAN